MKHPDADLLWDYAEEGIPAHTGFPWSPKALETTISKGTHASACTPEMTAFIWGEIQQRIKDGFIILLPAAYTIRLFGDNLKLSRIAAVPQTHCLLHLVLNLLAQSDSGTPSVNETTNREAAPESL